MQIMVIWGNNLEGQIGAEPAPMHHRDDPAVDTAVPAIKFRNSEILHNFIIIHRTWVKSDHFRQITNRTNIKNLFDSFLANLKVVVSYLLFEMFFSGFAQHEANNDYF